MFYQSWVLDRTNCPKEFELAINEYMAYGEVSNGCYVELDESTLLEFIDNEDDAEIQASWQSMINAINEQGIKKFILLIWW